MKDKTILAMWGATLVTFLEALAILKGIDGALFGTVVAVIAGLCGYHVGKER